MKKKIVILTQPLLVNYGGLLQAYALQKVLRDMGHDVVTDRYGARLSIPFYVRVAAFIYHFIHRYILRNQAYNPFRFLLTQFNTKRLPQEAANTSKFVDKHIRTVDFFRGYNAPRQDTLDQYDTIVVGSDQVWRGEYCNNIKAYYLNFTKGEDIKRIAYAASFGTDTLVGYSASDIEQCRKAIQYFDAVSVREDQGIKLCHDYLDIDATHLLDPTMLLSKEDYISLIDREDQDPRENILMCYMLDRTLEKEAIIENISNQLQLSPISVMPSEKATKQTKDYSRCIYPSVSAWIAGFRDAKFVVTDSFHGTVFAIIFNVPFVVVENKDRGASRFHSLLKIFGLESRLITSLSKISDVIAQDIDYTKVNKIKENWIGKSLKFLRGNI